MKRSEEFLIALLRAGLHSEKPADPALNEEEWKDLLRLAEAHKLLPLILDAAYGLPSCRAALRPNAASASPVGADAHIGPSAPVGAAKTSPACRGGEPASRPVEGCRPSEAAAPDWKALVLDQVARQVIQENEFLNLILALRERGLEPVVMKGCVCRALYPKPLLRPSVDDDLLIPADQAAAFRAALLELGLTADDPAADPEKAWELSFHKPDSPLFLELHKRLFDPDSELFRDCNVPFGGAVDRAVSMQIQDVTLRTLAPTDHLLFLILHAFKHFLYSGFGLRIVADVCLFSRRYAEQIDFEKIASVCESVRCGEFTSALYRIGGKYLDLPIPAPFDRPEVDESALLQDVLAAGLVGAEIDRLHSANITLRAAEDSRAGKAPSGGLRNAVFLPAKQLSGRYPWLEKRPWLLPVAWSCRVCAYLKQRKAYGGQKPTATLRIGKERVKLLEKYGVIDGQK